METFARRHMKLLMMNALVLVCVNMVLAGDLTLQKDFHDEIVKIYSFQPHTLSQKEMEAKSGELDRFWDKVNGDKDRYLPLLRAELQAPANPSFFYYDGSGLLSTLSNDISNQMIILQAIPKADLVDIQPANYLQTIHKLAVNELDTSDAALRILDYPDFEAFIPMHSLTLGQGYSLTYMLIPTKEEFYLQKLIKRLSEEKNVTSQKSIMQMLWYTVTREGDQAIQQFSEDKSKPDESRKWAKELLAFKSKMDPASPVTAGSYSSLKQKRKETMNRISDEALSEFDSITKEMRVKEKY